MIIVGAVAVSTVVSANTVTPTVSVQFSPCSILGLAVAVVGVGVVIGAVTGLIFAIISAVELKLVHDPIKFRFQFAVVFINLDLQS